MKSTHIILSIGLSAVLFTACERKKEIVIERMPETTPAPALTTLETERLGAAITAFEAAPTSENAANVNTAFSELEGEIGELDAIVAKEAGEEKLTAERKAVELRAYRDAERARFTAAQAKALGSEVKTDVRSAGEKVEDAARRTGESIEDAAKKAGEKVEDAAESVKDAVNN